MDRENLCLSLSDMDSGLCFPSVQKLGILGGSFNPIHYGHLILGRTALKALEAQELSNCKQDAMDCYRQKDRTITSAPGDEVSIDEKSSEVPKDGKSSFLSSDCILFLPTGLPYHKENKDLLSFTARSEMLYLALQEENRQLDFEQEAFVRFFYSTMEGERSGNSYTYDSMVLLKKVFPNADFFLIIGTDEYFTLEKWYKTKDLGKILTFLVANRNGETEQKTLDERAVFLKAEYGLQCKFLEMERIEYSSSLIRKRIGENASIEGMLPEPVIEFIRKNRYYEQKIG